MSEIFSTISSIIVMILLISVLILVHEAGHFFAAKAFKMKVSKFGFGLPFGPTLWEKQIGDLKILVHAFLLGGYVAFPDDDKELDLPKDSPDRFSNKPIYQRFIVVSAGVTANVICALVFVLLTAALWGHMPSGKYEIYANQILPDKNEYIASSGIQAGDRIMSINGSGIDSSYGLLAYTQLSKSYDNKVSKDIVDKNYSAIKKLNPAFKEDEPIPEGILVQLPKSQFEHDIHLSKNHLKGLEKYKDTQILLTDQQQKLRDNIIDKHYIISDGTLTLKNLSYALSDNIHPINMTVMRDNKLIKLNPVYPTKEGIIGIQLEAKEIIIPTKGFIPVVSTSCKYLYDQSYMLLFGLEQIITGKIPFKDLHGIVAIVKVGGDVINYKGFFSGLLLTAIISLDLAIVNFLPIPALDGGHVMFLIFEKINGKPLKEETIDKIGTFCFMLLVLLMIVVIFNDVFALVTKQL